jgi:hypothetical protein
MAQADQVVQNDTFPTVRADINNNLAALFTNSSGGTAPTVTVAYQDWIDTSGADPVWKKRNAANNAWITVATIKSSTVELAADNVLPSQSGNAGEFLTTDGTNASWASVAFGATIQEFTSSGTYTPTAGKTSFLVFCTGGGGGSGGVNDTGCTGGGGGGGTAIRLYNSTEMGSTAAVTVGAAGAAGSGSSFTAGGTGGASTFDPDGSGLTITGSGGSGSSATTNTSAGAAGGGVTNSQISANGGRGAEGSTSTRIPAGGMSFWAGGRGGGAEGAPVSGTADGKAGTAGIVVILEW